MSAAEYVAFARDILVPRANDVLQSTYAAYCDGVDIDVQTKLDDTPASLADRETEAVLRDLIARKYPEHGIVGEEYGNENIGADRVWVLDPLDGTREFLAKKPGCFGCLIGLLIEGRFAMGIASDPIGGGIWASDSVPEVTSSTPLNRSIVACTNPETMFATPGLKAGMDAVRNSAQKVRTDLNCMGFTGLVDGSVDVTIENCLKIHDLIPLIPVLQHAGILAVDLQGNQFASMQLDVADAASRRFGVIAATNHDLAAEIANMFKRLEDP